MAGGLQINIGQGTLTPPRSHGHAAFFGQGIAAAVVTIALVGQAIAASAGSVIATSSGAGESSLTGQSIAAQQQSISASASAPAVGDASTLGQGSVTFGTGGDTLNGQSATFGQGTLFASGPPVTVNISGVESTLQSGSIQSGGQSLSGRSASFSSGSAAVVYSVSLSGISVACDSGSMFAGIDADDTYIQTAQGVETPSFDVSLVGASASFSQGAFTITGDDFQPLVGAESASIEGDIEAGPEIALTGQSISTQQNNIGAPGFASLTGSESSVIAGSVFTDNDRTFALTGQQIAVQDGLAVTSYLAFATGQLLAVQQQGIGPRVVELSGISIDVTGGYVIPPPSEEVVGATGGTARSERVRWGRMQVKLPDEDELRRQREALGILPKKAQAAIRKIVEKATRTDDPEQAAILAAAYTQETQQDRLEARVKTAVKDSGAKWRDNMADIAQALVLGELQRKADEELLAQLMAAEEQERSEASEILQMWMNL